MDEPTLQLDELSDHDLLIRIATRLEALEDLPRRVRGLELEIARLKQWGPVLAAGITALASVLATVLTVILQ